SPRSTTPCTTTTGTCQPLPLITTAPTRPRTRSFPTRRSSDLCVSVQRVHEPIARGHSPVRPLAGAERADEEVTMRQLARRRRVRSEEHTSELQSRFDLVCRLLLEKKN